MKKFLIIDGNSIANRAYYALPFLTNHEGKPSGAVFGFANILIKIISEQMPSHVAVAFDHARKTFRNEIYSQYKGTRKETPPELKSQFPIIKKMLSIMDIKTYEVENFEADDLIGTICNNTAFDKIVLSGDRDLLQLIDNTTNVWLTKKGVSEVAKMDRTKLKADFGLSPNQIIELKGLMGDSSDNIPGVKGVGEKTAQTLLAKYENLDKIYKNIDDISGKLKDKLIEDKEMAFMSKELATIKTDCDIDFHIDDCNLKFPFSNNVVEFFREMDFSSLLKNPTLFGAENIENKTREIVKDIEINDIHTLESLIKSVKDKFAYNLSEMKFAVNDKANYFLSGNFNMFESSLSNEEVINKLKTIFEDKNILKLTLEAKEDLHKLDKFDIHLENFFDVNLAEYIINAGLKSTSTDVKPSELFQRYEKSNATLISQDLYKVYENLELPLVEILKGMEDSGFKIDEDKLALLDEQFSSKIYALSNEIYAEAGEEFNVNSPKQVSHILFEKLKISSYNNKKLSTSSDILDEYRYIPIVDKILFYRKYSKLKNTYIDVYKNICQQQGDIIHTTFNQTLTSTGRLSSSEPNLQTIPTRDEEGRELRKMFISKFDGGSLISADYNQIELRLVAHMSSEQHLIDAYTQGQDIHSITASQIFKVPLKDVSSSMRREAKAVNFGIIYGISDYGLSQNIKSTRAQAKEYIDSYFERYPLVKKFMDANIETATKTGQITTMFGRVRKIPEINSSKYMIRQFGQRIAMNMPLQGTASDIIKIAMINVDKAFKENSLKSQLILQIHDELIVDVYPGEELIVKNILVDKMQGVVKLNVPLLVSIGQGKDLFDCK